MLFGDLASRIKENFNRTNINKKYENKTIKLSKNALTSSWIGGSIITSMSKFGSYWISNKDYKDNGCVLVNKKCPY
jgi:actin-related protein